MPSLSLQNTNIVCLFLLSSIYQQVLIMKISTVLPLVNPICNKVSFYATITSLLAYKLLFLNIFSSKLVVVKLLYSYRPPTDFSSLINWLH
jgi:hypothetical protein